MQLRRRGWLILAMVTMLFGLMLGGPLALAAPPPTPLAEAEPEPEPEAELELETPPPPPPRTEPRPPTPQSVIPPVPQAWVNDQVGVLSPSARHALNRRLAAYEAQTGHQIIVWIDDTTRELPIETFAVEAFEHWRIGRESIDDGLGVFIMTEDRTMRVEVGYGLEPFITDLAASQVIRSTMLPAIERGDWDLAVTAGVEALVDRIEAQPSTVGTRVTPGPPYRSGRAGTTASGSCLGS